MEKILFLFSLLSIIFIIASNGPGSAFSLAFAQASGPGGNPLKQILSNIVHFTAEEIKSQVEEIGKGIKETFKKTQDSVDELVKKAATKDEIEEIKKQGAKELAEYIEKNDQKFAELQKQANLLDQELKTGKGGKNETKGFNEQVNEHLTTHKDALKSMKSDSSARNVQFDVKAVQNPMTIAGTYNGGTGFGLSTFDGEMSRPPRIQPFMRDLVSVRNLDSLLVHWAEKLATEGGADTVLEGAKKPQMSSTYAEASKEVRKIAVFTKASKESLDDIKFLRGEINADLVYEVEKKLDEQILNGNDVAPNLKGIKQYAPDFAIAGTPFGATIASANKADVLLVGSAIIQNAGFDPNIAVVNPMQLALMNLTKDANGQYILPPFSTANGTTIAGLRVVSNRAVALDEFLIGDFNRDILGIREEINIQIGYEMDDFTKNLVTILAEMRAVNYIKAQNIPAFLKGTFTAALTAIRAV